MVGPTAPQVHFTMSDWLWMKFDFAQEEARLLAAASGDAALLADFAADRDVYCLVGEDIYTYPMTKRSHPQQRFNAKQFFLAHGYGAAWPKLVQFDPQITPDMAKAGVARMDARYPLLAAFAAKQIAFAREHGYVQTILGRKRCRGRGTSASRPSAKPSIPPSKAPRRTSLS